MPACWQLADVGRAGQAPANPGLDQRTTSSPRLIGLTRTARDVVGLRTLRSIADELVATQWKLGSPRYALDVLSYRALRVFPNLLAHNPSRTIKLRNGRSISYRCNRGDIQGIREVFLDEVYRLPDRWQPRTIIDLGANIGLTSLWYADRYPIAHVVAVEPVPENAALLRSNLSINGVPSTVVEAAVGPRAGRAMFTVARESNLGRLGGEGTQEVSVVTMPELIEVLGSRVDLLKMDIEGGEQDLLTQGDLAWLDEVDAIIAEFHSKVVDYPRLTETIASKGLQYYPAQSLWSNSMDLFVRR